MPRMENKRTRIRWTVPLCVICALALFASAGCAGPHARNYGRIIPDGEVTRAFEAHQNDPDLDYYISGSDLFPNAILGLNKRYTLHSTLWKRVAMTSRTLGEFVSNMQMKALSQHGFVLLDDKGNRIGVWYSILSATTSLWMKDDHTVVVLTPPLDTYDPLKKEPLRRTP